MRIFLSFACLSLFVLNAFSQLNMELVGNLSYNTRCNDVWGYTSPDGTEYALVGLRTGISIVNLADPANPEEVVYLPGEESGWRDLRTYGDVAYVLADQPGTREGLWTIDLSNLPSDVTLNKLFFGFENDTLGMDTLFTGHNIWVDDDGYAYLTGTDINSGGVVIFNLNPDPFNPTFEGLGSEVYSHDNYVRNNILYTSEIFAGGFGAYDVTDKSSPMLLATQETPFKFTHNVWLSDDGNTLFTTDEKANAPTTAYDVSDLNDIKLLDEFRPISTLGKDVIPHNVHVLDDYLVISHYTDGCVIVDAQYPDNLIEVGNYDTNNDFTNGFHGDWGAYPFFPSGLIAVTDIENGLFILQPHYQRASYLEGQVTDITTSIGIPNVSVNILSSSPSIDQTDLVGNYKTGTAAAGTFQVTFQAIGYFDHAVIIEVVAGEITVLNVQLTPLPSHSISGQIVDETSSAGIEGAQVLIENDDFFYLTLSDQDGFFTIDAVLQGVYNFYLGKWGYENLTAENRAVEADEDFFFETRPGYEDNFNVNLDWAASGAVDNGAWERGLPNGTQSGSNIFNPFIDSPNDPGGRCFVTGNADVVSIFQDNVDNGTTILTSPVMALKSRYDQPMLSYDAWFFTVGSNNAPNDTLKFFITNGTDTVELQRYDNSTKVQEWTASPSFDLSSLLEITDDMQFVAEISDVPGTPNIVEGGIDNFKITETIASGLDELKEGWLQFSVFPNPFSSQLNVQYKTDKEFNSLKIMVFDLLGRQVEAVDLMESEGQLSWSPSSEAGIYFLRFQMDEKMSSAVKLVKMED